MRFNKIFISTELAKWFKLDQRAFKCLMIFVLVDGHIIRPTFTPFGHIHTIWPTVTPFSRQSHYSADSHIIIMHFCFQQNNTHVRSVEQIELLKLGNQNVYNYLKYVS